MTETAINYAKVLYELGIDKDIAEDARAAFEEVPELKKTLTNPVIPIRTKHRIIEKVFPEEIRNFFKILCDYRSVEAVEDIFAAYKEYYNEQNGILTAHLVYVDMPDEKQLEQMGTFLCKKYGAKEVEWNLTQNEKLFGGFVLRVKDYEYDWSLAGRMNQIRNRLIWR